MPSSVQLIPADPSAVPAPVAGRTTLFINSAAGNLPSVKDSAANVVAMPRVLTKRFTYADTSPSLIGLAPNGKLVLHVRVFITQTFDGTGAALTVGSGGTPNDLMASTDNTPGTVGLYEKSPAVQYGADTNINITITPGTGATQGAGLVIVEIEP